MVTYDIVIIDREVFFMDEFEKIEDSIDFESEEENIKDSIEQEKNDELQVENTDFAGGVFTLGDDEEIKKSKAPMVAILTVVIASIFAVGCFMIVRHDRQKANTVLISTPTQQLTENAYSAEEKDGELYINGVKVDKDDVGLEDEEDVKEYVSKVNKGSVTLSSKVAKKYNIKTTTKASVTSSKTPQSTSSKTSANSSDSSKSIVKPNGIVLVNLPNKEYEVGQTGKVNYNFTPLGQVSNSQKGVIISSSNPSVAEIDHLGNFKTKSTGTVTFTVQSKVNPNAKASLTIKVVDKTTTKVIRLTTTTAQPTTLPSISVKPTTTKETSATHSTVDVNSISFSSGGNNGYPYQKELSVGGSALIRVNISPSNATTSDLNFRSTDTSVCTVDANGRVYARGKGTAQVIISPKTGSAGTLTATIVVK